MLWFSNDNPAYTRAVYEIETTKADILRMEAELRRLEEQRASSNSMAELLETNIEYIRKYAKVVSMKEYTNLKHQLADEYAVLIHAKNEVLRLEKVLVSFKDALARLEARLPSFQSKVLEFKPRD